MINDIIGLLNDRLKPEGVFSVMATAPTETLNWKDGEDTRRIPAYFTQDRYKHLTPYSNETGILSYRFTSVQPTERNAITSVSVRVVGWLNKQQISTSYLARKLSVRSYQSQNGSVLKMIPVLNTWQDDARDEFSGYDLSQNETAMLDAPYRTFSIDLTLQVVTAACIDNRIETTYC